jgi:hypothetical protein
MDFVEWWKKSSKEASEAHYALRFDANELNDIRRGFLSDSAGRKLQARLKSLKKRNTFIWLGCGIPALLMFLLMTFVLGFFFFRALWQHPGNPIMWIFSAMLVIFILTMSGFGGYLLVVWVRRRSSTATDLKGNKVGIYRGRVFIKISHSENSFNISYFIKGVEFILFDDAIGWEIHTHFFGGPNITGQKSRETKEEYIFYCLPGSKRLLHFELA